jgi:GNAT superfamily N-acetyltransferase
LNTADVERAAARHWQAPEEGHLGEWLLRAGGGFTGRANSALAVGDPGLMLADAVDAVAAWYQARNLPPMVAVPLISPAHEKLDSHLSQRRWTLRSGAAFVMTADLAAIPAEPAAFPAPPDDAAAAASHAAAATSDAATRRRRPRRLHLANVPDAAWLARYHYRGSELPPIARKLLLSAPAQCFMSIRDGGGEGEPVAIARLSLDGDWAGLSAVEVDPSCRRQGLGTAITLAACAQARRLGAGRMFLQVEKENMPARALYARAGFRDSHEYHYRVAPASGAAPA